MVNKQPGKLVVTALVLLNLITAGAAAEQPGEPYKLNWNRDVRDAWRSAVKANRPLLVFITMDDCIYCRRMKKTTLADQRVVDSLRAQFVPVSLNVKDAPDFVKLLMVKTFPATVVIQPNGDVIRSISGYKGPKQLRYQLHTALRYVHQQQANTRRR